MTEGDVFLGFRAEIRIPEAITLPAGEYPHDLSRLTPQNREIYQSRLNKFENSFNELSEILDHTAKYENACYSIEQKEINVDVEFSWL